MLICIAFAFGGIDFGQPLLVFGNDVCKFFVGCEVGPFECIVVVIIEFFRAIAITNVAIAFGADAVVLVAICGDYGVIPLGVGIV